VRILGFAMCLLSLNYSPAFCDMAKFLCVDSENTFVVGQRSATVLPHVFLVKVKFKGTDEYRRTVDEYICRNVYKAICSYSKVCVCVCVCVCVTLHRDVQTSSRAHRSSYLMGTSGSFPGNRASCI